MERGFIPYDQQHLAVLSILYLSATLRMPWTFLPLFQRNTKVRQCVAGLEAQEEALKCHFMRKQSKYIHCGTDSKLLQMQGSCNIYLDIQDEGRKTNPRNKYRLQGPKLKRQINIEVLKLSQGRRYKVTRCCVCPEVFRVSLTVCFWNENVYSMLLHVKNI